MKKLLLSALCLFGIASFASADTLYSENFGTPSSNTAMSSFNDFSDELTSSIINKADTPWKVSKSISSTYEGASGGGNAFASADGDELVFGFGDTFADATGVTLSFGYYKASAKANDVTLECLISYDGGDSWSEDIIPNDAGKAGAWYFVEYALEDASNLYVKFLNKGRNNNRIDDVTLATAGGVDPDPEPAPFVGDYSTLNYPVVFEYAKVKGTSDGTQADAMSSYVVSISSESAVLGNDNYGNYRFYKDNDVTIESACPIVKIVFEASKTSDTPSGFTYSGDEGTYDNTNYVWTGYANEVVLSPSAKVFVDAITVYVCPFRIVETADDVMNYNDIYYDEDNDQWVAMAIALNDEAPYANINKDIVAMLGAGYERECAAETWQAICLPFDVDPADMYGGWSDLGYTVLKLIEDQTTDNGYLTFEVLEDDAVLEAQVPYLISSDWGDIEFEVGETTMSKVNLQALHEGNNVTMTGTLAPTDLTSTAAGVHYALKDGVFRHAGDQTKTLKPYRAYVTVVTSGAANGLNIRVDNPEEETEGIEAVEVEQMQEGVFYNLKGQKVNKPSKGLYIFNGQKVMIK